MMSPSWSRTRVIVGPGHMSSAVTGRWEREEWRCEPQEIQFVKDVDKDGPTQGTFVVKHMREEAVSTMPMQHAVVEQRPAARRAVEVCSACEYA